MTTNVALLPEKWRMESNRLSSMLDTILDGPIKVAMKSEIARAREDAKELEAALASQPKDGKLLTPTRGEAVATVRYTDTYDGQIGVEWHGPLLPEGTGLYTENALRTLAVSPRGVDDAMVERACSTMNVAIGADSEWPSEYPEAEQSVIRNGMRAGLTAALSQPSGEEV